MIKQSISQKIQSLRDTVGVNYIKPSNDKVLLMCKNLKESSYALDYLRITRNLSNETIEHFKLGYDIEKNAISIPVYKREELINIRYRMLNKDSKVKYIQEKGAEVWLYNEDGISKAQSKGGILIVEGEFDCMSAWQAGFKNVISPASGKDSYGVWIDLLDSIPKIYISYDNDKAGRNASRLFAERIGTNKCFEVLYPEDTKDANDFFQKYNSEKYKELLHQAKPFYKYKYKDVKDVIHLLREKIDNVLKSRFIPFVEFEEEYIAVLSGVSNVGKTSVVLNIANELSNKNIPVLVFPIERGIRDMVKRFLQIRYNKTKNDVRNIEEDEWDTKIIPDVVNLPLYFSIPTKTNVEETIIQAKKYFGIKIVIVDHLDLLVRNDDPKNLNVETSKTIQVFKRLAQEYSIIFILVHHIKKIENNGSITRKPRKEDLKGTSTLYQDPEVVILLSAPEKDLTQIEIDVVENKGTMGSRIYEFNVETGVIGKDITETRKSKALKALDDEF